MCKPSAVDMYPRLFRYSVDIGDQVIGANGVEIAHEASFFYSFRTRLLHLKSDRRQWRLDRSTIKQRVAADTAAFRQMAKTRLLIRASFPASDEETWAVVEAVLGRRLHYDHNLPNYLKSVFESG